MYFTRSVASVTDVIEDTRNSFLIPLAVSNDGIRVNVADEDSGSKSTEAEAETDTETIIIEDYEPLLPKGGDRE